MRERRWQREGKMAKAMVLAKIVGNRRRYVSSECYAYVICRKIYALINDKFALKTIPGA